MRCSDFQLPALLSIKKSHRLALSPSASLENSISREEKCVTFLSQENIAWEICLKQCSAYSNLTEPHRTITGRLNVSEFVEFSAQAPCNPPWQAEESP